MLPVATNILLKIFDEVQNSNSVVLVGGQCLLIWAVHYESQGHNNLQVATEDVDILGTKKTVQKLEKLLNTRAAIPGWGDMTPEVGVFKVPVAGGKKLTIDVLSTVAGLNKMEVEKYSAELELGSTTIKVLNPVGMLKTRIANVITLRRRDKHSMDQLKACVKITGHFIESLLSGGGYRFASKEIADILYMAENRDGIQIFSQFGIDILDSIPKSHINYPESFKSRHLAACMTRIERKRQARVKA
ncbi:hypothetical protein [Aliikangiella sp. IMCC44359]|uniref:hypothetical protein n=1 Tax=Aliikangiella sp. IMCC44359 TaxID=3459125 RepID=UPI00403AA9C1